MDTYNFEDHILGQRVTSRGGGVEIDLTDLGYKDEKMSAYQNYLGGGLLGRVGSDCTLENWRTCQELVDLSEQLKRYYFNLTNPDSEWESFTYEQNQKLPIRAY